MLSLLVRWSKNDSGATSIEYAIVAALLALSGIVALQALGETLDSMYTTVSTTLDAEATATTDSTSLGEGGVSGSGAIHGD